MNVTITELVHKWWDASQARPHALLVHAQPNDKSAAPIVTSDGSERHHVDNVNRQAHRDCTPDLISRGDERSVCDWRIVNWCPLQQMYIVVSVRDYPRLPPVNAVEVEEDAIDDETTTVAPAEVCTGSCCRHSFRVNFASIGYDWIVSPKQYDGGLHKHFAEHSLLQRTIVSASVRGRPAPSSAPSMRTW